MYKADYLADPHYLYYWMCAAEFRRVLKKEFYGWCYGNYQCKLIHDDFCKMYDMGGEL